VTPERIHSSATAHGAEFPGAHGRPTFRCAARLLDGTYLPCVLLCEARARIDAVVAIANRSDAPDYDVLYPSLLSTLAVSGNRVEAALVAELEQCPYAIPWSLLSTLSDGLNPDPVEFTAQMDDGVAFSFGTAWDLAFFDMPTGYTGTRIRTVLRGVAQNSRPYRERPYFVCFVEGVEFGAAAGR
jgi:hypothetical protein